MTAEDKAKNAGKVALVLEGGSFRGQFTAGVLDVLMEAGVEIPAVYGVSAGALNGVNYKSHQIGRTNRVNLTFCNDSRYMGAASFASTGSIVGYDLSSTTSRTAWILLITRRSTPALSRCTPSRRTCSLEPPRTCRSKAPCSTSTRACLDLVAAGDAAGRDRRAQIRRRRRSRFGPHRARAGGGGLRSRGCHCHAGPLVREKALRVYACRARPLCRLPLPARGYRDAPRPL